jgi:hypothetical protein
VTHPDLDLAAVADANHARPAEVGARIAPIDELEAERS